MSELKWFAATVTVDINCGDNCPRCRRRNFSCTECEDGQAVMHMWGHVKSGPFFKKDTKVIVARRESWLGEHDWNGVWQSIQYPEMYYVFEPSRCGRKLRVTRDYAMGHLAAIRPLRDMTEIGSEAFSEWNYQMSR